MKNKLIRTLAIAVVVVACGQEGTDLASKKKALEAHKTELRKLQKKITGLQNQIGKLDSTVDNSQRNAVLITTIKIAETLFIHKIAARGSVASRTNVLLSAEMVGKITSIKVSEGQSVSKGQLLATLDGNIIRNNIAELKTNFELATTVYERQENLWKQNIGSEIKYLETKAAKEGLERKLATTNAQLDQSLITAPFSGIIDAIPVRVGEMAQPGMPFIRIVNPDDVYIRAGISEKYVGKFSKGQKADVYFPYQDQRVSSTLGAVGQVIDRQNRTFEVEVKLPPLNFPAKPNQVVVLYLKDYENNNARVIPARVIQKDDRGQFVFVIENNRATKKHITTGLSYHNRTEVLQGLELDELIADKGYRELAEGVMVRGVNNAKSDNSNSVVAD